MLGNYFYHERIKKSVAMFGSLFNNIYILRKDANDKVLNTIKVPLAYAPSRDYIERIRENPDLDLDTKVAIKLPRMSFEILGYQYDAQRQLNKTGHRTQSSVNQLASRGKIYNSVPYTIDMQLSIYTKTQDDALQIVEQIIPYFSPQYTLTIKPFSDHPSVKEDVPIILNDLSFSDDYEGAFERRTIIYQLTFQMHANFYQSVDEGKIIRKVTNDFYTMSDSDYKVSTLTVEPNPLNVSPDSDYGFTETLVTNIE
jgi:hypothetical protein